MEKTAKEVVASGSVRSMVDYAIEVNRQIVASTKELEEMKVALREKGQEVSNLLGKNQVEIEGNLGVAQITFVKSQVKPKKGVDLLAAEGNLPPEVFNLLFVKKTVVEVASDFEGKQGALTPAQRMVLANLVEIVPSTPRVNLPK